MIDYRNLAALAAVVDAGGFEKAAAALHITQSAVSQRLKSLEDAMGQVLLVRSAPPAPTAAGRRLLAHWRQVRLLEEDALAAVSPDSPDSPDSHGAHDDAADPRHRWTSLPLAVNADSLATWLLPALDDFLRARRVLLDLRVDDQEATHQLLRDGDVLGCISDRPEPMQGCRVTPLRRMTYRLVATPAFASRWFPEGMTLGAAMAAPLLAFNRKDDLHNKLLRQALGLAANHPLPPLRLVHLPSSEGFVRHILHHHACGMLPDDQSAAHLDGGELVNLAPRHAVVVTLHWHCWNLESPLLKALTAALAGATPQRAP